MRSSHRNIDGEGERRGDELGAFAIRTSYAAKFAPAVVASPALQTVNAPPAPVSTSVQPAVVQQQQDNFFATPVAPAPAPAPRTSAPNGAAPLPASSPEPAHEATGTEDAIAPATRVTMPRSSGGPAASDVVRGTGVTLATLTDKQKLVLGALLVAALIAAYYYWQGSHGKGRKSRR